MNKFSEEKAVGGLEGGGFEGGGALSPELAGSLVPHSPQNKALSKKKNWFQREKVKESCFTLV